MAKKKKDNITKNTFQSMNSFLEDERVKKIAGLFFLVIEIFLVVSFIYYIFKGRVDQDKIGKYTQEIQNFGGSLGHSFAHKFIYKWFGISSFLFPIIFFLIGIKLTFEKQIFILRKSFNNALFTIVWVSISLSFFTEPSILGGVFGFQMNIWLSTWLGKIGTGLLLFFSLSAFIVAKFNPTLFRKKASEDKPEEEIEEEKIIEEPIVTKVSFEQEVKEEIPELVLASNDEPSVSSQAETNDQTIEEDGLAFEVNQAEEEETLSQIEIKSKIEELGDYDPTLDLSNYKIPSVKLLNDYGSGKIEIDKEELEANKNRIVETLGNYKIGIASISATVGPTITLYEIVPEAGVRISKIKNLEDDIALSLSALGIRIIAPIPGRGTIGIEVPNQNPATVSMKAVLSSDKFQNSEMELPVH